MSDQGAALRFHETFTLAVYRAFMWSLQPLLRLKVLRRARREPGYATSIGERFGRYDTPLATSNAPLMWVHAVSLGEARCAQIMMPALRAAFPDARWLFTHSTATGREAGRALLHPGDEQAWLPWDTPKAIARFLARFQPQAGLVMETEVWPELVQQCHHRGVPLLLLNGRLAARSALGAHRGSWLMVPAYHRLAGVWAQTQADAERYRALQAPVQDVTGNLKFDALPDASQTTRGAQFKRDWQDRGNSPIVVLASARDGEERNLLAALNSAGATAKNCLQWLIVPRHPQRFDEVAALIEAQGLRCVRRSAWPNDAPPAASANTVWLGDSMGEMSWYYALSDAALMGGSFQPLGGQNLIEACAVGCPVVLGPSTFNFAEPAQAAIGAGAAVQVNDLAAAVQQAVHWCVSDRAARDAAATAAAALCETHRGATQRTVAAVARLLRGKASTTTKR